MAWCSRSERGNLPGMHLQTSARVGPGAYDVVKATSKKTRPSFAPFASSTNRGTAADAMQAGVATPGPGYYAKPRSQQRARVSGTMRSGTQRFRAPKSSLGPGPGEYEPPSAFAKATKAPVAARARAEPKQPAVKWVRVPTVPSIPGSESCWGYEEGPHGELVQQQPATRGFAGKGGDSVGPMEYQPRLKSKPKGAQFGRSRSRRSGDAKQTPAPGPGYYNARDPKFEPVKPSQATFFFQSRVARGLDLKAAQGPGPGSYTLPSAFKAEPREEELQFFGSSSERFPQRHSEASSSAPGPGQYRTDSVQAITATVPPPTNTTIAFASTSNRFHRKTADANEFCGPGSYQAPSMAEQIEKKMSSRTGVFGSTTKRFYRPAATELPGPGAYTGDIVEAPEVPDMAQRRPFQSSTQRFKPEKTAGQAPAPGQYNPVKPLGQGVPGPRLDSGPNRFKEREPDNLLGPGEYAAPSSIRLQKPNRRNVMGSVQPRFQGKAKLDTPGPGSYDTSYLYDGLVKPTFNMTVAE